MLQQTDVALRCRISSALVLFYIDENLDGSSEVRREQHLCVIRL